MWRSDGGRSGSGCALAAPSDSFGEFFLFHNFSKLQKWPNLGFLALFEIFDFFEKFVNFQKSKTLGLFPLMGRREINVVSFESYSCQLI